MNGPDWDGAATRLTSPDSATLPAMSHRHGIPRPPADIENEMIAAGAAGDDLRLGLAHGRYVQWLLTEHGISEGLHGNSSPEEAWG